MQKANKRYFNFASTKQAIDTLSAKIGFLLCPIGTGAEAWRDEIGDALALQVSGAGITLNLAEGTADYAFNAVYNANPALADFQYKNVQLNHDRNLAVAIYPHVHWFQSKNYSPNFLFEYRWQTGGAAKTTAWTKLACTTLVYTYTAGTIKQKSHTAAGIAVPVNSDISDIVQFRIYRDNTNASGVFAGVDPYNTGGNASVPVLSIDVHIAIDSIGSTLQYMK